jgi:hypothetical protein
VETLWKNQKKSYPHVIHSGNVDNLTKSSKNMTTHSVKQKKMWIQCGNLCGNQRLIAKDGAKCPFLKKTMGKRFLQCG